MSIKIFLVLIVSLWVVQCHVLSELHATQTAKTTTSLQKEDLYSLMFPTAVKRKTKIEDKKNLLRIRRQLKKEREGRGWSYDSYYGSSNSRPIRNDNNHNPNRDVYTSSEQQGSSSSHHNVNWDNIHIIEFNRARGRPATSQKSQSYGENEDRNGNRRYQNPNYENDQSSDRRQSSSYGDSTEGSSFLNTRRSDEDDIRHGFTASLEKHYVSEHDLEYSDHDIDEDKYTQRSHQVLPKPESQSDQESRPNYYEAFL